MATSRDDLLNSPRSGARPLAGSPGASTRPIPRASSSGAPRSAPSGGGGMPPRPRGGSGGGSGPRAGGARSPGRPKGRNGGGPGRPKGSSSRSLPLAPRSKGQGGAPSYRNYQAIILAEFIAAELLVSLTPIATRKNQPGLSPYVPRDMTKLLAIGMVFFLLELTAVTGRGAGRYGAWFGLLILLTVGLFEANNIAKDLDIFGTVASKITGTSKSGDTSNG